MWSTTDLEFRCLDFWTPLLEGDEGRRAGNALGLGVFLDAPALASDAGCVPRRHSARVGGLAAALGDAGFGTPARRGSLPSPALGGEHAPRCGQARPSIGDGAFQARE